MKIIFKFILFSNKSFRKKPIDKIYNGIKGINDKGIVKDINKKDKSFYRIVTNLQISNQTVNQIKNIKQNNITIYSSTYNTSYNKFFHKFNNTASRNTFVTGEVKNTLFESLMGVKYLITDKPVPLGYKKYKRYGNYQHIQINNIVNNLTNSYYFGKYYKKIDKETNYKNNLIKKKINLIKTYQKNYNNYKQMIPFEEWTSGGEWKN